MSAHNQSAPGIDTGPATVAARRTKYRLVIPLLVSLATVLKLRRPHQPVHRGPRHQACLRPRPR